MTAVFTEPPVLLSVPRGGSQVVRLIGRTLNDRWRSTAGWGLALVGMAVLQLAVYPSVAASAESMRAFLAQWPDALQEVFSLDSYATGAGFLNAELFSMMFPLVLIAVGLGAAAAATAGEEEKGTADVLFALPAARWRVLLAKTVAMLLAVSAVAVAGMAALAIGAPMAGLGVPFGSIAAGVLMVTLLALVFASLGLAVGALTGRRAVALGVGMGAALMAFLLNALAPMADWLEPWRDASPFQWALGDDPVANGVDWPMAGVMLAVSAAFIVVAAVALRRRDIESR